MSFDSIDELIDDSQSFQRSRSSQDILNSMPEMCDEQRIFKRIGALRKPCSGNKAQRCSVALPGPCYLFPGANEMRRFPSDEMAAAATAAESPSTAGSPSREAERARQKGHKNTLAFWKSIRNGWRVQDVAGLKGLGKLRKSNGYLERKSMSTEVLSPAAPKCSIKNECQPLTYLINDLSRPIVRNKSPVKWILEQSWTELVKSHKGLTKIESDLQAAIWELITTEVNFLDFLWLMVEIFLPVFYRLQAEFEDLSSVNTLHVFGNIDRIYQDNTQLWETCISLPVLKSRADQGPLDILLMRAGFLSIASTLSGYVHFMKNQVDVRRHFHRLEKCEPIFKEYVQWTKAYSRSHRDGVQEALSAPFHRITKYKLLLDRIRSFADEHQGEILNEMADSVHCFLDQLNSVVSGEKQLEEIQSKLVPYSSKLHETLDTLKMDQERPISFDLTKSMNGFPERVLIHDGQLKLVTSNKKKCDVQCYLFNDLFLMCKPIRRDWDRLAIFKSPIRIDKFLVIEESEGTFVAFVLNDFFTFDSELLFLGNGAEVKLWIDKCNKTRTKFESLLAQVPHWRVFSSAEAPTPRGSVKEMPVEPPPSGGPVRKFTSMATTSGYSSCSMESSASQAAARELDVVCRDGISRRHEAKIVSSEIFLSISSEDSSFVLDTDSVVWGGRPCGGQWDGQEPENTF